MTISSSPDLGPLHLRQAHNSIQQTLHSFAQKRSQGYWNPQLMGAIRPELQKLKGLLEKIEQKVFKIAVFGLVSQGKSALINALVGQKILTTGPLHGVTPWPQSLRWRETEKVKLDLIDTPGLDEIDGQHRAEMARQVAQEADLILFVVAGDVTQRDYQALRELRQHCKPLLLVFNKIDLYPPQDREVICQQLQALGSEAESLPLFTAEDIVCVAAQPQPVPVRLDYPDRPSEEVWETPPPIIEPLRQKILTILNREGQSLLALNALLQARGAENQIAQKILTLQDNEANNLINRYAQYKALAIAVNPIVVLDLLGGLLTDLFLVRALTRLYGLPITSLEIGRLGRKILTGSGGLILAELLSTLILGWQKTVQILETPGNLSRYGAGALLQATVAGYGSYAIGQATQQHLQQGLGWGPWGINRTIQEILAQVNQETLIHHLPIESLYAEK